MWFSESVGDALGAWLGVGVGISGGVVGVLVGRYAPKGKLKGLVMSLLALLVAVGVASLGVGLYALLSGQPYHVWYPFVLIGVISTGVFAPIWFTTRTVYRMTELHKMTQKDVV